MFTALALLFAVVTVFAILSVFARAVSVFARAVYRYFQCLRGLSTIISLRCRLFCVQIVEDKRKLVYGLPYQGIHN